MGGVRNLSLRLVALALMFGAITGCRVIDPPSQPAGGVTLGSGPKAASPVTDVQYGTRDDQLLDLHMPNAKVFPGPRPVIVWLHAGGFTAGSRKDPMPLAEHQIERGYAVASVEYGLSPDYYFPTPVEDVKYAIRWLKYNAAEYGLDAKKVYVGGYSAGAELAALVAASPGDFTPPTLPKELRRVDDRVQAALMVAGGFDFTKLSESTNPWARGVAADFLDCDDSGDPAVPLKCPPGRASAATILNRLHKDIPPAYFVHGSEDPLFPPLEQQVPLAIEWGKAKGDEDAVWAQHAAGSGHGIDVSSVNLPKLDEFIDAVYFDRLR